DRRQKLAQVQHDLALLLAESRPAEAEPLFGKSLALREGLARQDPKAPVYRYEAAFSHWQLGTLWEQTGKLKEAAAAWRRGLALREQLTAEHPKEENYRWRLAASANELGYLLETAGRLADAVPLYHQALAEWDKLISASTHPYYRQEQARTRTNLANVAVARKKPTEAQAHFRAAIALRENLAITHPKNAVYRRDLAHNHFQLARVLRDEGQTEGAVRAYRRAAELRERLADEFPKDAGYRQS